MRKTLLSLAPLVLLFVFLSCQKERSFEIGAPGSGTLLDASGDCSPKIVGGTYVAGRALTDSNYIDVGVYVIKKGSYTISAPVQNGFSFRGTGTYANDSIVWEFNYAPGVGLIRYKATQGPSSATWDLRNWKVN